MILSSVLWCATHSANFDEKVHKPKSKIYGRVGANIQLIFTHILWIWILLSVNHNFWGSEGLQGTYIDALNPFSSKLMTLAPRGGLWTFLENLALCAPRPVNGVAKAGYWDHREAHHQLGKNTATPVIRIQNPKTTNPRNKHYKSITYITCHEYSQLESFLFSLLIINAEDFFPRNVSNIYAHLLFINPRTHPDKARYTSQCLNLLLVVFKKSLNSSKMVFNHLYWLPRIFNIQILFWDLF